MILADKLIQLRKQHGWSQEQLAEQLNVSRQSVSKWESGLSIPDLDKIIKMSEIFGVSTDYLLKDDLTEIPQAPTAETGTSYDCDESILVTVDDANTYMDICERFSKWIALGVALCVFSPIPLIFLGGYAESYMNGMYEDAFAGLGVAILLVIVAIGVSLLIVSYMKINKWEFLQTSPITLQYGVKGIVEKKKQSHEKTFIASVAGGVALCILGVVPLLAAAGFNFADGVYVFLVCVLLAFIGCAVFLFVKSGIVHGCYQKLLQEGEYTRSEKRTKRKLDTISTIYWCSITAVYLFISFNSFQWHRTWIIWPVAGVFYAVVEAIARLIVDKN